MSKETEKDTNQQLDQALTEMDVLAATDRKIFRVDSETFRFQEVEYKLIENHREAFDMEMMEERFTDYLFKYDYIVGDIAYEKLRLRGFYEDDRKSVPIDMKISHLEDYLIEYCNFGCKYFVFERIEKKEEDPEPYFKRSKKSNRGRRGNQSNRRGQRNNNQKQKSSNRQPKNHPNKPQNKQGNQKNSSQNKTKDFKVKKVETTTQNKPKQQPKKQEQPKQENKQQFKIRKKKD